MRKKLHFYNMAFLNDKGQARSLVVKQHTKLVTMRSIENARISQDLNENTVLMSVSYLGRMTEDEYFNREEPVAWVNRFWPALMCVLPFIVLGLVVWLKN